MHWLLIVMATLLALGIIVIAGAYLASPWKAGRHFGLPLPEDGPNIAWWRRLKGVRDVLAGLLVLTFVTASGSRSVGVIFLVYSLIPAGDMLTTLLAKGSTRQAFGVHGCTAAIMLLAALPITFWAL